MKTSFSTYVVGSGGDIAVGGPASALGGAYVFPHVNTDLSEGRCVLQFAGNVRFRTHTGSVDVIIESPWIHIGPNALHLSITGTEQTRTAGSRLLLSELKISDSSVLEASFETIVAPEGAALFDFHYSVGTEMDLLTLSGVDTDLFDDVRHGRVNR